jgi:ABC-type spermidine/putrescine transport system permease subunit I
MSSFVISDVMGENKIQLIGNTIQLNFDQGQWHSGSLIALIMLIIIGVTMLLTKNVQSQEDIRGSLW